MTAIRNKAKLEKRITETVDRLVEVMELGWLEVVVRFNEELSDDRTVASARSDWQYRRCVIAWNLDECASLTDDEITTTAIHELCHGLIDPLWSSHPNQVDPNVANLNELATENVARVVQALLTETETS